MASLLLSGCVAGFSVLSNPVLLVREHPSAVVFLDGQKVDFDDGTYSFLPFKKTFKIVADIDGRRESCDYQPWHPERNSNIVVIHKGGIYTDQPCDDDGQGKMRDRLD